MIEPIMFVGIGFLVAGLLVIGVIPLVHARAVRLTQRRLEAITPMSMGEIRADRDQLRAEFAMATRRLELTVEQLKAKTASQFAEIGKKSESISRLKFELGEKTAALHALEARENVFGEQLQSIEAERAAKAAALEEAERKLAATAAELSKYTSRLRDTSLMADSQRVELIALQAQSEVLTGQIESYERETRELHDRIARDSAAAEATSRKLAEERAKTGTLGERIGELERQLLAQMAEAETREQRVQELVSHLDEQRRFVSELEQASELLRGELAAAKKNELDLRTLLAEAESRGEKSADTLRAENAALAQQLKHAVEDRAKLLRELETIKHQAEAAWEAERTENAVVRERINDVAAEVARLTSVLEGPTSPIEAILADDMARAHATTNGGRNGEPLLAGIPEAGEGSKGTLADRIRALQSRTSRVPQPSSA
jgi:chromosome segregation ATPase